MSRENMSYCNVCCVRDQQWRLNRFYIFLVLVNKLWLLKLSSSLYTVERNIYRYCFNLLLSDALQNSMSVEVISCKSLNKSFINWGRQLHFFAFWPMVKKNVKPVLGPLSRLTNNNSYSMIKCSIFCDSVILSIVKYSTCCNIQYSCGNSRYYVALAGPVSCLVKYSRNS